MLRPRRLQLSESEKLAPAFPEKATVTVVGATRGTLPSGGRGGRRSTEALKSPGVRSMTKAQEDKAPPSDNDDRGGEVEIAKSISIGAQGII